MSKKIKLRGRFKTYKITLYVLGIVLVLMTIGIYFLDYRAGIIINCFVLLYFAGLLFANIRSKQSLMNELISFATEYGQVQRQILRELQLPHALLDQTGKVIWTNAEFEKLVEEEKGYRKSITNLFPTITMDKLPLEEEETQYEVSYKERDFMMKMKRINVSDMVQNSEMIEVEDGESYIIGLYLFDETALKIALKENDDQSLAVGLIYLDNYEEALEDVEDVRRSLLLALIDRKINKYVASVDGIVRKLEKDKYLLILRKKAVTQLKEGKFEILEDVKTVNIGNEIPVTLSMGIGLGGLTYGQNTEFARAAIDLALGRGGDQTVVKIPGNIQYFGGKSQQTEKSTRVKARVKAQALKEIIEAKDQLFVMGHRLPDADSFGAAVGIYAIAKALDRKAHIVMNDVTPSLRPMVELFEKNSDYDEDMILTSQEALEKLGNNAVLVVVDINKPSITECPELLKHCKAIVVLDHHRQSEEVIDNATLSYIEPYASSACEMVAEILQYVETGVKIKSVEADCLYSGIMIDTNNFMTKTGVRTFEAAAFLRRNGADVTRVRKLFREDASEYMAKAKTIRDTMIYRNDYAISICDGSGCQSPTIVAAQAANELLNINGVKASFVFTEYQDKVFLSARSIDELNVQIVTERLGGGGHMNIAGAQFTELTVDEAVKRLHETLD
ncbi:MAG: DHH family phosphoesterase, partial [Lachnospiraceae bacterium]|nr:DHH family phosphoesterase [Lachnospiraceae bacterium]